MGDAANFKKAQRLTGKLLDKLVELKIDRSAGISGVLTRAFEEVIQNAPNDEAALEIISACLTYALPENFGLKFETETVELEDDYFDDDENSEGDEIRVEFKLPEDQKIN